MSSIFSNSIQMTGKTLDYLWKRQEVISENIANVSTPGYKAKVLTFEDNLKESVRKANPNRGAKEYRQAIERFKDEIIENNPGSNRLDENDVSIDAEFVEQARAGLQYQYAIRSISDELAMLRSVIRGQ